MAACFSLCRKKAKNRQEPSLAPGSASVSVSAPPSTVTTSRSDDSAAGKHTSKSTASTSSQRSIPAMMNKIGEGGFGSVYKAYIKPLDGKGDRIAVAVKRLNQRGLQGHKQWLAEVQFLGVLEHPNLVKLIGYCAVDSERGIQRLLVYEFMPNKSLEDHLFNRNYPTLSWNLRLQIALGAAEGLAYLHEGLEVQVIYRDFKASNVLLDKEFRPKLSDFGLAREGPTSGLTHVSTGVVGTHGYAAPDYIETGHLTVESDVWSFGVVMYEILTGRRALDRNRPSNEQKLLEWVRQFPVDTWKFSVIIDPRLRSEYSLKAAREVAKLANSCLVKNRKDRPKMHEAVERLKQAIQISSTEAHSSTSNLDKQKRSEPSRR
ncbi:probable serine/threonine-protein kinase PBL19 isoform X2 [Elaeis guineensis]|uniref:Probable serine/threonine-protein kinase PBL19 isoform X2 n=1 Tax=Elaeis guineensis var. tenera TaxID=51953 RepID=A0A6I9SD17_ELAGV|nr:probable serine/threonine-protein kinase PBL19 isoform X2 [Elaeis guineensis]